jgi:hypothetical protein
VVALLFLISFFYLKSLSPGSQSVCFVLFVLINKYAVGVQTPLVFL